MTRTCYLLKAGATTGITDHASGTDWGTTDGTVTYGSASDLWGTTWTPAQINASNFGVRLKVGNRTSSSRTASINRIRVTVTYSSDPTAAIGSAASPIERRRHRRHVQAQRRDCGDSLHERSSRLRDDDHGRAAGARQATDRSRLVVGEREARPEAPVHRGR